MVTEVPSGLPRLPDDQLEPPAGPKAVDDIADYSDDPARERDVLEQYGYRYGWERFWGTSSAPMTGVFVDQFESARAPPPTPRTSPATTPSTTAPSSTRTRRSYPVGAGC